MAAVLYPAITMTVADELTGKIADYNGTVISRGILCFLEGLLGGLRAGDYELVAD